MLCGCPFMTTDDDQYQCRSIGNATLFQTWAALPISMHMVFSERDEIFKTLTISLKYLDSDKILQSSIKKLESVLDSETANP